MTCKECGKEIPADAEFCPECGVIVDRDEPPKGKREQNKRNRGLSNGLLIAILVVASLLLIAVTVLILDLSGVIDLHLWKAAKDELPAGQPEGVTKAPSIEMDASDGERLFVTVYAKEGSVLIYESNDGARKETEVPAAGSVKYIVPFSSIIPLEPIDGETVSVTPKVFIRSADGAETPIVFTPVEIPVPALTVVFDSEQPVLENGSAVISGRIQPCGEGCRVTVNGENVGLDGEGRFSHTVSLDEAGEYELVFEAKSAGYRAFTRTFRVTVTAPSALIQFPWEYGDTAYDQRITSDREDIKVKGRVPAGSSVTVSCFSENAALTEPAIGEDGEYSFTVTMAQPGDYELNIVCVTPSGERAERVMHVQRAPDWRAYVESSWKMSYEALKYASSQAYKISGTVTEIIEDGDYIRALLDIGDGKTIVIVYHHHYGAAAPLEVGSKHTGLYGHPLGRNENGVPVVYVWFVIN